MSQNSKPVEDATDRELPQNIVGAIEHHIRMSKTPSHRVGETGTGLPKFSHVEMEGAETLYGNKDDSLRQ